MPNKEQEITQIGNSITIKGDILGKSDVRVAGNVQGSVNIEGDLVVERTGRIEGEIKVTSSVIAGTVKGNIDCTAHPTSNVSLPFYPLRGSHLTAHFSRCHRCLSLRA